jgi:hypothetical protein
MTHENPGRTLEIVLGRIRHPTGGVHSQTGQNEPFRRILDRWRLSATPQMQRRRFQQKFADAD